FSSRRRHTRFSRDWSSDVCSSDLAHHIEVVFDDGHRVSGIDQLAERAQQFGDVVEMQAGGWLVEKEQRASFAVIPGKRRSRATRSEERRVGKEWSAGWRPPREKEQ